jgi:Flp pilus assembly secretin CpaC
MENAVDFIGSIGQRLTLELIGHTDGDVWGTDIYTADSDFATAAVHAGLVRKGERGRVTVVIVKSPAEHLGITRNGVTTKSYGSYAASYILQAYSEPARNLSDLMPLSFGPNGEVLSGFEVYLGRRLRVNVKPDEEVVPVSVDDLSICEVVKTTPQELFLIGRKEGMTKLKLQFKKDGEVKEIHVKVSPDVVGQRHEKLRKLEELLAKLFPDSKVYLKEVDNRIVVQGEAKDWGDSAQIMTVVRHQGIPRSMRSGSLNPHEVDPASRRPPQHSRRRPRSHHHRNAGPSATPG